MSRKKKIRKRIVIGAVICMAILLMGGLFWGGSYLVKFAIGRSAAAPGSGKSEKAAHSIVQDLNQLGRQARDWVGGSEVEEVRILSDDGLRLYGEAVITDSASHKWVIAAHGYGGSHSSMTVLASWYGVQGYNALLPDLRAWGDSEGDYIGMGWLDRKDMLRWIDWITSRDSEAQIVLHGVSMGGATVMMTAGEELPDQVKAVVEDCGYTSVWDIFADELDEMFHLPPFPFLYVGSGIALLEAGYNFSEASAVRQVAKARVPILFIHGANDDFVRTDMVYSVYDACSSEKELFVVKGAGHADSFRRSPANYFETVFGFLADYMEE